MESGGLVGQSVFVVETHRGQFLLVDALRESIDVEQHGEDIASFLLLLCVELRRQDSQVDDPTDAEQD